jgi:hypothetical protein
MKTRTSKVQTVHLSHLYIKTAMEKRTEFNLLYMAFVDYEKAYDTVNWQTNSCFN